jgi:hypothetical protein
VRQLLRQWREFAALTSNVRRTRSKDDGVAGYIPVNHLLQSMAIRAMTDGNSYVFDVVPYYSIPIIRHEVSLPAIEGRGVYRKRVHFFRL